ncbi:hypothetical protein EYF80_021821 [Liparis tanakae]|uniref:SEA domain-containing protein n=1 Tax=Liparis tanakae TaxID=230148 RepID=A0A4Z2HSN6_9TELE|nr:hypothetical protein EYF80_021821 [Liparis tanakae]
MATTAMPTTAIPATTPAQTTIVVAPPTVVVIATNLEETFVEEFNDRSSQQFMELESRVTTVYNEIFSAQYGDVFSHSYLIGLSRVPTTARADLTKATVGVVFATTNSTQEIPQAANVSQTLVTAVSNSTFNVTVVASSITVLETTTLNATTTSPVIATTTAAKVTTPAAKVTTTAASAVTTAAKVTTTVVKVTTPAPTTVAETVITRLLTFRSQDETFTSDLLDPSSAAFQSRATLIETRLRPSFSRAFSSFRSINVISFREGSIIQTSALTFSSSAPNSTQIQTALVEAAATITDFNVDTTSIFVDGTQVSSGVSHKISLFTASFLVLMSWILSSQQ